MRYGSIRNVGEGAEEDWGGRWLPGESYSSRQSREYSEAPGARIWLYLHGGVFQ